jgi:ATP-dependent metalloprotease FtsH
MVLSAVILVVLFSYAAIKGSAASGGYIAGLIFLIVLLAGAFFIASNKEKVKYFLESKFDIKMSQIGQKEESFEQKIQPDFTSDFDPIFRTNTNFEDIHGVETIKTELLEIVDFLNNPKRYKKFGVKLPKGVLLVGSPGVGKTMIAKAMANEANVPFFYQSGASFVQIYVGMGAKRVRDLFAKAKSCAPSIIFIDEIDAVGKKRGGGRSDERDGTLNELLTQMDGFEDNNNVVVIAATNNIEVLDDALLRSGRFDRRIFVPMPNANDREDILRGYLKDRHFELDLSKIAKDLAGFSGASIATLINEASLNQLRRGSEVLELFDIEIAKNKVRFGTRENKLISSEQKELLSLYQSTKAFFAKRYIPNFEKMSLFDDFIISYDKPFLSKSEVINLIKLNLCGHLALEIIKFESYNIFPKDLQNAKKIASEAIGNMLLDEDEHKLFMNAKSELKNEILQNKSEILKLKVIMAEKEEIKNDDIIRVVGSLI